MTERMYRAQILLDPKQRRKLEDIARREGRSISAVTRQVIDAGLETLENQAEIWQKRSRILSELRAMREQQGVIYGGNLIEEARQERENETDEIWQSHM
jgi:hypothetical protein